MNVTQNDLSFNSTKLDYKALLTTAEIAFAHSREEINRHLSSLYKYPLEGCFYLEAEHIEWEAKSLHIISETMYTLREGLTRQDLEIVNKPEVKEE